MPAMSTSLHLDKVLQLLPGNARPPWSGGALFLTQSGTMLPPHCLRDTNVNVCYKFLFGWKVFFPKELDVKLMSNSCLQLGTRTHLFHCFFQMIICFTSVSCLSFHGTSTSHPKFPCDWPPLCPPTVISVLDLWKQLWFYLFQTVKRCLQSYSRVRSLDFCWLISKLAYSHGKFRHWLLMSTFWNLT